MRIRTRNTVVRSRDVAGHSVVFTDTFCDGSIGTYKTVMPQQLVILESYDERMADALGRGKNHDVMHRKIHTVLNDSAGFYLQGGGPTNNKYHVTGADIPYYRAYEHSFMHATCNEGWGLTPDPDSPYPKGWTVDANIDESLLQNQVIEAAKQLKADVLLNLVEANQIYPAIQNFIRSLTVWSSSRRSPKQMAKVLSSNYLAWKFGVAPILSDMASVIKYTKQIDDQLRRHGEGKPSRYTAKAILRADYTQGADIQYYQNGNMRYRLSSQGTLFKAPCIRYVLVVKPRMNYKTDFFKKADFFMRRFATSPASLAWERIPFSFVVDWFVDLRGVLNALDKLVGFEPYEVVSFTRSLSYGLRTDSFWTRFSPCSQGLTLFDGPCGTSEFSHYERNSASSQGIMPRWRPRFGKSQAGITAALITQQLTKLRSWR